MRAYERFMEYALFPTMSDEKSSSCPSTKKQHKLAKYLKDELISLGLSDARVDDNGYVYATLPKNFDGEAPAIGFIAHMDTSEAVSGANVNPRIIENYDGKDIVLNEEKNIVTYVAEFPMLKECKGKSLIVVSVSCSAAVLLTEWLLTIL